METVPILGSEIYYDKDFLPPEEATVMFRLLQEKCAWERPKSSSFKCAVPRDEAYYGDPGTNYTFPRSEYEPAGVRSRITLAYAAPRTSHT
jgi:hypothetical protein